VSIANYVTLLRIVIVPFFPLIYLKNDWFGIDIINVPYFLIAILVFCEFTDLIDGVLARKRNEESDLGKVLDPMADSITRLLILFTFTQGAVSVPILVVFVFLYREFIISTLRTICAMKGFALAARRSGKIKAVIQACVNFLIVILLLPYHAGLISIYALKTISLVAIVLAAIYSVATSIDYIYSNRDYVKKALSS
jgi:CDP-diacylglycerol---glycerol-3-phosphate 3-phosphatidyltransferase